MRPCTICGGDFFRPHLFRETMFATHETFPYTECLRCGCLQILDVPADMAPFYRSGYYSFSNASAPWWKLPFYRLHFRYPERMARLSPCTQDLESVIAARPRPGARILDVGSGAGRLVAILRGLGFDAHGVDPFLHTSSPLVTYASLDDVDGQWDLIMFHHSLEHMLPHANALGKARALLAPGGTCLVRIPVVNWAWRHFGRHWFQLDAPRHFLLYTPAAFERAARAAGFHLARTVYDSGPGQFFFSEFARRGIPIVEGRIEDHFSPATMASYNRQTQLLNLCEMGDQAAFFLTPTDLQ